MQPLSDYYRIPEEFLGGLAPDDPAGDAGFFQMGPEMLCYGQCSSGVSATIEGSALHDALQHLHSRDSRLALPFDPARVVEHLRREHYESSLMLGRKRMIMTESVRKAYYFIRDILPNPLRRAMQRVYFSDWKSRPFPSWPVDFTVDGVHEKILQLSMEASSLSRVPFIWFWPEGAPNCLILTHDVETSEGRDFTPRLMDLDDSFGFKAAFQVIPERRYTVDEGYVREIRTRGFEFNIHDLNHDGHLYREREEFLRRARQINAYARQYGSRGFRAGSMYRIQDWFDAYQFSYDMSVPNVAHFEPRRGGCCTVFPYFVGKILEIPLTTCQDYTLFHIFRDYSLDLWKQQIGLIGQRSGLLSFLSHPDYLLGERERNVYAALLEHLRTLVDRERIWAALPGDVDRWWRARSQMKVVRKGEQWVIEGPEKESARLAFAVLEGNRLRYELAGAPTPTDAAGTQALRADA